MVNSAMADNYSPGDIITTASDKVVAIWSSESLRYDSYVGSIRKSDVGFVVATTTNKRSQHVLFVMVRSIVGFVYAVEVKHA